MNIDFMNVDFDDYEMHNWLPTHRSSSYWSLTVWIGQLCHRYYNELHSSELSSAFSLTGTLIIK